MALQITNPVVIAKVAALARLTRMTKTSVVERAIDRLAGELLRGQSDRSRMAALLAQIDRIPDRADVRSPLEWNARGLPV